MGWGKWNLIIKQWSKLPVHNVMWKTVNKLLSFVFPLPNAEIMWSAYGKCCNHFFFYKVATAHFVLCISSSLLKTTKNVGVKHYIQWFHCCSNFVVYFYLKSFSFLVERSLLLLPRSMVCDMNIYMKNCLLLSSILINFWAFLLWILPVLRAFLSSWNFSAHCKFLISFSPQTLPTPYRNYFR